MRATLVLRPAGLPREHEISRKVRAIEAGALHGRSVLSFEELETYHEPRQEHLERALGFAADYGLDVVDVSRARHDIVVEGPVGALNRAFRIELERFEHRGMAYHAHRGPIHLPGNLHDGVVAALGLHGTPLGRRLAGAEASRSLLLPTAVASYYDFPPHLTGKGRRIAILAFGGGYDPRDLAEYFVDTLGLAAPTVTSIGVSGTPNAPLARETLGKVVSAMSRPGAGQEDLLGICGSPEALEQAIATIEVTMDIEIAGAIAPQAEIDVYLTRPGSDGFYWAVNAALGLSPDAAMVHDPARSGGWPGPPTVISVSWGDSEAIWTPQERDAMNLVLSKAAHLGVTVCCASGDFGSLTRPEDHEGRKLPANVSFPASSPHVLAVGGTCLPVSERPAEGRETVWNGTFLGQRMASGGGFSGVFERPDYQSRPEISAPAEGTVWVSESRKAAVDFRGRAVPDVAANAAATSGYQVHVGGTRGVGGGTSASAPLWAGLVALLAEGLGRSPGWLNPLLYAERLGPALRSIDTGDNEVTAAEVTFFRAKPGWDACTGLGVPIGQRLLELLAERE